MGVEDEECGTALRLPEDGEGLLDAIAVVGVADAQDVPAVPHEPGGDVLREGEVRLPFDGDVVVVVDPAEVVEAEVAGERGRLRRHALHQAAVPAHGIDVVVEDLEAWPVVSGGEPLAGDGHPHAGGGALPERTGGGFDTRHPMILGVPGRPAADLAEAADVVQRHRRLPEPFVLGVHRAGPGQMQHGPEQHRGVTVGEDEPIAVGPDRVQRIEVHHAVPERVDERRQCHRRAGMARFGALDRIDGERADGVHRQTVELGICHLRSHRHCNLAVGFCQPPGGETVESTSFGPQLPGSYS